MSLRKHHINGASEFQNTARQVRAAVKQEWTEPAPISIEEPAANPVGDAELLLTLYHKVAAGAAGAFVLGYVTPATEKEAAKQPLLVQRFGKANAMATEARDRGDHANIYFGPALMRSGIKRGKRGEEKDITAVLALVLEEDRDTDKFVKLPPGISRTFEVETSHNPAVNRHLHFVFDKPLAPKDAKELARLAHRKCGGDSGGKDITHVWRVPDTLNHPDWRKLNRGRPREPQPVRLIGGTGEPVSVEALRAALEAMPDRYSELKPGEGAEWKVGGSEDRDEILSRLPPQVLQQIELEGEDRSAHCFAVTMELFKAGLTDDEVLLVATGARFARKFDERGDLDDEISRLRAKWIAKGTAPVIDELARMSVIDFAKARKGRAAALGISQGDLAKAVTERKKQAKAEQRQHQSQSQQECGGIRWPDLTEKGEARGRSQPNIMAYTAYAGIALTFNCMTYSTIVTRHGQSLTLTEEAANSLWLEADQLGLQSSKPYFTDVIENTARKASFHPIRDYLESIEWDGVPRLDEWLHAYLGAENTPLNSAYGRKHLIAAVRRVRSPGIKHDTILVLQGPQGGGKSSTVAALCPSEEYFTDSLSVGADQKEVIETTAGKWLVELAELDGGMGRRDAATVKAMLSRRVDAARLAYGRLTSERPRQFVLFGTVNEKHYLRDMTGNRRFWPVTISGKLEPDEITANIARDRDQLWAEAAHYEEQGECAVLPKDLWAEAAEGQAERMLVDPWQELLSENLHGHTGFISMRYIYDKLDIMVERRSPSVSQRIAGIMGAMGYDRKQRRCGDRQEGKRVWGYHRG